VLTEDADTLSHTMRDCKCHVVFIPKYRRKALYKGLRRHLAAVFRSFAEQKKCRVEGNHLIPDHVHKLLAIPPQYAAAQVEGRERKAYSGLPISV
jgi:putative transposase